MAEENVIVEVDLSEVPVIQGFGLTVAGVYKFSAPGPFTIMGQLQENGCQRARQGVEVVEGPQMGAYTSYFFDLPTSKDPAANRTAGGRIKANLVAMGVPEGNIKKLKIRASLFVKDATGKARVGTALFIPKNEAIGQRETFRWLIGDEAIEAAKAQVAALATAPAAGSTNTDGVEGAGKGKGGSEAGGTGKGGKATQRKGAAKSDTVKEPEPEVEAENDGVNASESDFEV